MPVPFLRHAGLDGVVRHIVANGHIGLFLLSTLPAYAPISDIQPRSADLPNPHGKCFAFRSRLKAGFN